MNKLRTALLPVIVFAKIDIRRLFRDKVAIFFVFAFPLIFLFIFGTLNNGNTDVKFKVGLVNQSQSEFSKSFADQIKNNKTFDVDQEITNLDQAREKMNRSEVDATIILPTEFGNVKEGSQYPRGEATVLYDQNNQQAASTLSSVLEGVFKEINSKLVPTDTPFTVKSESTATAGMKPFDYTFAGLLGFAILSLGVFGPSSVFPRLKTRGVLRRYRTTTLKVWQYFLGNVISSAFVGLMSVALMFAIAIAAFDLKMQGDYMSLILFVILGTAVMFGIGLSIGGWAKNENQAAPVTQIVAFPLMFLSGTFFPRFIMPEWLQSISTFIPLSPFIDGIRMIVTEGKTLLELGPQVAILVGWGLIIYVLAFRVFRWE